MFAYSTSLPYYLDYIASAMTRQDILDDPSLCYLLENPYFKDNMEMALRFKSAKRRDYKEKKDFLEYFFCNGPELDADTVLYYREKCLLDPALIQIAAIEFGDIEIVDELRSSKYGKSNEAEDCYTKACNYLAPLDTSIGMIGDSNNFLTLGNIFAKKAKEYLSKKDSDNSESENKDKTEDKAKIGEGKQGEEGEDNVWGHIRQHLVQKIIPEIREKIQSFYTNMQKEMESFAEQCNKSGILKFITIGDPNAIERSEAIAAASKMNVYSKMGDCGRLWQYLRQYNPYDSQQNTKGPIPDDSIVANKTPQGTSLDSVPQTTVKKKLSDSGISSLAARGDKVAEAIQKLNNLDYPITLDIINKLKPNSELSNAEKLELWNATISKLNPSRGKYRSEVDALKNSAGIGNTGEKYAKWQDAVAAVDAKHDELSDQFWELQELMEAISLQESGTDQDVTKETEEENKLWESDADVVEGSEQEQAAAAMARENQEDM